MKISKLLPAALLLLALGGCSGRYVPPSQAVSQDIAASRFSGAGTSSNAALDFRDSDLGRR